MATKKVSVEVILPDSDPKKSSIKFTTAARGVPITNLYLSNDAHAAIGSPEKIKVTIEPAVGS